MRGMSKESGGYLDDLAHLKQSIIDILSTPIGSRVICRDYGSEIFELIDAPINGALFGRIYAAIAEALDKWEPRFKVENMRIQAIKEGHIVVSLVGRYLITQERVSFEDLII